MADQHHIGQVPALNRVDKMGHGVLRAQPCPWSVVQPLLWRSWTPSVVGLLEQRELVARRCVGELREEVDRIQAELAVSERDWKE